MPSVDGIVSGLDTTGLINAIVTSRRVSLATLTAQKTGFEKQREAVAGVKNRLTSLSEAIGKIDEASKFRAWKAETASTSFKITASDGAVPGSYPVRVDQLARSETSSSQGYAERDADYFSAGAFTVTVGGTTSTVTLGADSLDLEGLAEKLNEVAGVDAYVMDTGASNNRYLLMVQGTNTGSAASIDVDFAGIGGGPVLTEQTTAVDALVNVAGIDIVSSTNTLSGAIPGVRLELLAETAAPEAATVSVDLDATQARFQAVIDAYNEVIRYQDTQSAFDVEKDIRGPLVGESSTRKAVEDIGRLVSSGFTVAGTALRGMSELGIKTQRDGTLELDATVFAEKFDADPESVEVFLTSADGPLGDLRARIDDYLVDSDNGSLVSRGKTLDSTIEDLADRIALGEERITAESERLRAQFTAMEAVLGQLQSTQASIASMFSSMTTT
jgi:flagellar hook-associated protein 2